MRLKKFVIAFLVAWLVLSTPIGAQDVDSPPQDFVLDTLKWLRDEVYPGLVQHPLDDIGISAWLVDWYPRLWRSTNPGDPPQVRHSNAKHALFKRIYDSLYPPPPPTFEARKGQVRFDGRAFADDAGTDFFLGASAFPALWAYRHDRQWLDDNCACLAKYKLQYIRVFAAVGDPNGHDPWQGREVQINWPDHEQVLAATVDYVYDTYGLRTQLTLMGDVPVAVPTRAQRDALVDRVIRVAKDRPHKFLYFEIANEYWVNGIDAPEMRRLATRLRDGLHRQGTPIPVALSSPASAAGIHGDGEAIRREYQELYSGILVDLNPIHSDRTVAEDNWRAERQTWEWAATEPVPSRAANQEPRGPESSVSATGDPVRVVAMAVNSAISKIAAYTFHTDAGVWAGNIKEFPQHGGPDHGGAVRRGTVRNICDHPQAEIMLAGLQRMQQVLPRDLPNWTKHNHYWSSHPFANVHIWTDDNSGTGVVRAFGATAGNAFVVNAIGIRGRPVWTAKARMKVKHYHPVTWDVIKESTVEAGGAVQLTGQAQAEVLIGHWF